MVVPISYQHDLRLHSRVDDDRNSSPHVSSRGGALHQKRFMVAVACCVATGFVMFMSTLSNQEEEGSLWLSRMSWWGNGRSSSSNGKQLWSKWSNEKDSSNNKNDDYFGFDFGEHTYFVREKSIVKHKRRGGRRDRHGDGSNGGKGYWDYKYDYEYDSDEDRHLAYPGLRLEGYPPLEMQQQYLHDIKAIDWDAVEKDIEHVLTDSQDCKLQLGLVVLLVPEC